MTVPGLHSQTAMREPAVRRQAKVRHNLLLFIGGTGTGPGEFLLPAGLFVDDEDRIYIADQGNARVQVFQRVTPNVQRK